MTIRITGMSSGMDIDKLVSDLMKAEKAPLDKMNKNHQKLEWKTDLYREINSKLASFRDTLSSMRFSSTLNTTKATSSDSTAVSVTSTSGAPTVSHTINVSSLATSAVAFSTAAITEDPNSIGSSGSFTINGQSISYTAGDTLSSVISKVNASSAGVVMSYDSVSNKVKFISKTTGSTAAVNISGDTGSLISNLNLNTLSAQGTDAQMTIDGMAVTRSSNSFSMDGINYTLYKASNTDVSVNVQQDTDALFNKIKDFVSQYNDVMSLIVKRSNEDKIKGYDPLTSDQKADMKDSEITLWESKAKSGLLKNDSILQETYTDLRSNFSNMVQNLPTTYNAMYKIGITTISYTTSGYDPNNAGQIQLDETKLKDALAADPDGVMKLFTNQPASGSNSEKGIAQMMYEQVNKAITSLINKAGRVGGTTVDRSTNIGNQIYKLDLQIESFQDKLNTKEDYYYKRFSAMEQAIANGNSQLSALSKLG